MAARSVLARLTPYLDLRSRRMVYSAPKPNSSGSNDLSGPVLLITSVVVSVAWSIFATPSLSKNQSNKARNYQLEKSLKVSKSIQTPGYFWLPETPDERIPGVLSVSKHGEITVDLVKVLGNYVSEVNSILNREHQGISRVNGIVRDGGYVTLTACDYLSFKSNLAGGLDKVILGAQTAFVGADFQQVEMAFTEYDFWVEGLSEWLNHELGPKNWTTS